MKNGMSVTRVYYNDTSYVNVSRHRAVRESLAVYPSGYVLERWPS